jgi:hypothetical protein
MLDAMESTLPSAKPPAVAKPTVLDDIPTLCAISIVATMLATMLHEGLGHAAVAIATLHASGTLTTVAWSSTYDSKLVLAGGTLANLAAALVFWLLLRVARNSSPYLRFFLLITMAFNLFTGTGYFFFSGVSNFGDWAGVIQGLRPYWLWRVILIVIGIASYWGAMVAVAGCVVRYLGVPASDRTRFRRLTWTPYFAALVIEAIAGLRNPFGIRYVFESALAASAGGHCALLFLVYYAPKSIAPGPNRQRVARSYAWIIGSAVLALIFILVLGPGIHLRG